VGAEVGNFSFHPDVAIFALHAGAQGGYQVAHHPDAAVWSFKAKTELIGEGHCEEFTVFARTDENQEIRAAAAGLGRGSGRWPVSGEINGSVRHLQDFAAILLLLKMSLASGQHASDHAQGLDFFLQSLQFGFFSAKHFDGVFHESPRRDKACKHFTVRRRTGKRHRGTGLNSVSEMVRMPLQYSERPIHLFQQDHPRELMRQRHSADREHKIGFSAQFVAKAVGRSNGKH
jgi:hypothetical protein